MRTVKVLFLTPAKKAEWFIIPWGKFYLDWYRKLGYAILMTEVIE